MNAPTGVWLTQQLRRAEAHAHRVADLLERSMEEVLTDAGAVAAAGFTARATALTAPPTLTAAAPAPEATMVCLKPTPEQAAALAYPGGEPAEILHVTLCYLGKTYGPLSGVVDALRPVALLHASLSGVVGGVGVFAEGDDGVPQIALPSVPGLVELRVAVAAALEQAGIGYGRDYGYVPHMTLSYALPPGGVSGANKAIGQPLTFGDLLIVRGDTEIIPLPLSGQPPLTAALEPVPGAPGWMVDLEPIRPLLDLVASEKDAASKPSMFDRIRAVAEAHRPEGGYGETWYRDGIPDGSGGTTYSKGCTVFWTCADWSTNEEIEAAEAAFLAIDGVGHFDYDAEGYPTAWRLVYGGVGMTAAGPPLYQWFAAGDPPPFLAPAANEILDVEVLIASITARLKPVRDAAVAAAASPVLEGVGIAYDVTNPLVAEVLSQSGSQIVEIAQTTQLNVMRIVAASYREGLSIPNTAKAIREGMAEASPARARLIARTEMVGAVNGGSLAAVQTVSNATGVAYHKVWMTAPGAKHPRHYLYDGLNGQQRTLNGKFSVAGYELDHPGDPQGPAGEICNCRCAMRYDEGAPSNDALL